MANIEEKMTEYLTKNMSEEVCKKIKTTRFTHSAGRCFKNELEEIFDCKISCNMYDDVINGEGKEKNKIMSVYSSSLQSLLFFSQVSPKNSITINGVDYTKAYFEYKNKVIKSPSSMDVVLVDKKGRNVLFIESKLLEIIRDSDWRTEDNPNVGDKVIGESYFNDIYKGSYKNALGINDSDFIKIGIEKSEKGKSRIINIDDNNSVYSEGIKQMLAHMIGIKSFISSNHDSGCSTYLDKCANAKIFFMELYNGLPGFDKYCCDAGKKIEAQAEYKKHIEKVRDILDDRIKFISGGVSVETYQSIYKNNPNYRISNNIAQFYHLKED